MKITELKRNLEELSKDTLITTITDIYKKNDFVKDYLNGKFGSKSDVSILVKYKDIIEEEFFPEFGEGKARLSVAKKSITEFKKISNNKMHISDLMLFYVEIGVNFTACYGDIDENFYMSMERMYGNALKHIEKYDLSISFLDRSKKIVDDTVDMGWGFHDELCEIYYSYYE